PNFHYLWIDDPLSGHRAVSLEARFSIDRELAGFRRGETGRAAVWIAADRRGGRRDFRHRPHLVVSRPHSSGGGAGGDCGRPRSGAADGHSGAANVYHRLGNRGGLRRHRRRLAVNFLPGISRSGGQFHSDCLCRGGARRVRQRHRRFLGRGHRRPGRGGGRLSDRTSAQTGAGPAPLFVGGAAAPSRAARARVKRRAVSIAVLAAACAVPWLVSNPSRQNFLILAMMTAQLAVAWNILGGYAGQVSFGHAAFYGLGAYTSSVLLIQFGVSPWIGMVAGGVLATLFALLIGWPCFKLKGHYFAIATIAVAEIVQVVFTNWRAVGGAVGLYLPLREGGLRAVGFHTSTLPSLYIPL